MTTAATWGLLLALAIQDVAVAGTQEHIGSWIITCPVGGPCAMRFSKRFLDKSGVTGDLEIDADGDALVPVLAVRGLSNEVLMAAVMAGKTEASLQLAGGAREPLECSASESGYICAPDRAAGLKLAAALPAARQVTVRVTVAVMGMSPLPTQEKSLELTGTAEALARVRAEGPTPVPNVKTAVAAGSAAGLMGVADRALKAAGYPNGLADLQARLAKLMAK
jgi:hypothetical protein